MNVLAVDAGVVGIEAQTKQRFLGAAGCGLASSKAHDEQEARAVGRVSLEDFDQRAKIVGLAPSLARELGALQQITNASLKLGEAVRLWQMGLVRGGLDLLL